MEEGLSSNFSGRRSVISFSSIFEIYYLIHVFCKNTLPAIQLRHNLWKLRTAFGFVCQVLWYCVKLSNIGSAIITAIATAKAFSNSARWMQWPLLMEIYINIQIRIINRYCVRVCLPRHALYSIENEKCPRKLYSPGIYYSNTRKSPLDLTYLLLAVIVCLVRL